MQNVVDGYMFFSIEDAKLAEKEKDKIARLQEKMDESDMELVYKVYNKCIETRSFKTPIGLDYMRYLKKLLEESENVPGEVLPIPLFVTYESSLRDTSESVKPRIKTNKKETYKEKFLISVCINVILVGMVITMFVIATMAKTPNILNYENAIINQYAGWEEELNQREQELREKEALSNEN